MDKDPVAKKTALRAIIVINMEVENRLFVEKLGHLGAQGLIFHFHDDLQECRISPCTDTPLTPLAPLTPQSSTHWILA